jgi:hypothetical protein
MPSRSEAPTTRVKGTYKWLQNHRKMLRHMLDKAEKEVEEAESAVAFARCPWRQDKAEADEEVTAAEASLSDKRRNLYWQQDKQYCLDNWGVVYLDQESGYDLSPDERQWNENLRRGKGARVHATSKGATKGTSVNATSSSEAAYAAPPAASAVSAASASAASSSEQPVATMPVPAAAASVPAAAASVPAAAPWSVPAAAASVPAAAAWSVPWSVPAAWQQTMPVPAAPGLPAPPAPMNISRTLPPPPSLWPNFHAAPSAGAARKRATTATPAPRSRMQPRCPPEDDAGATAESASPPAAAVVRARGASAFADIPPMPDRLPPFVLEGPHEARPELDIDWTLCPEDFAKELRLRTVRNTLIKDNLLAGHHVCYRSSGWSLYPRVHSNDQCTYAPVTTADEVHEGDIVFCEVQPHWRFYAHHVRKKEWWEGTGQFYFVIASLKGRENGWCYMEHIYGRLVEVIH